MLLHYQRIKVRTEKTRSHRRQYEWKVKKESGPPLKRRIYTCWSFCFSLPRANKFVYNSLGPVPLINASPLSIRWHWKPPRSRSPNYETTETWKTKGERTFRRRVSLAWSGDHALRFGEAPLRPAQLCLVSAPPEARKPPWKSPPSCRHRLMSAWLGHASWHGIFRTAISD